jgi:NAD(P)-dependent dehydrogenase (short-subunit alcohol dehydrogenase family)
MNRTLRNLHQTTVAITGASAGIGRAVALRFARAGARLALIARDPAALEEVKREAEKLGASAALAIPADVADAKAVFDAADKMRVMSIPGRAARLIPVVASALTGLVIGLLVSGLSRFAAPASKLPWVRCSSATGAMRLSFRSGETAAGISCAS